MDIPVPSLSISTKHSKSLLQNIHLASMGNAEVFAESYKLWFLQGVTAEFQRERVSKM
jgi:hypothetical protein